MVLKKVQLAVFWDKLGLGGWSGMPSQVWVCSSLLRSTRPQTKSGVKTQAAVSAYIEAMMVSIAALAHYGACPVPGSRDACHGCLRGPAQRECWVLTTGGPGHLVEPTQELFGIRGGRGASDSQKILGNRYPLRLGRAEWSSVNPLNAGWARRVRSLNRVFQARARRERKKPAVPIGLGTCEWGGQVPHSSSREVPMVPTLF